MLQLWIDREHSAKKNTWTKERRSKWKVGKNYILEAAEMCSWQFEGEMNLETAKVMRITRPLLYHIIIDQKQLETVEYFNCLDSLITEDTSFMHEIKDQYFRISMAKAAFNNKKAVLPNKLDQN